MSGTIFSLAGYASVGLSVGAVLLGAVYFCKPSRNLARAVMALTVLAWLGARVNSWTHVGRVEVDPAEQQAVAKAREEQRRKTALASRGEEVADIRFAEDDEGDYYDRAGMDEADLKYLEGADAETPAWKQQKRQRSAAGASDDSLESLIGGPAASEGVATEAVEQTAARPAILLSSADVTRAHQWDRWNLRASLTLLLAALVVMAYDYLRRANRYAEASLPLPLPAGWREVATPMPAVVHRPVPPRRDAAEELLWLLRRGESFVYLTDSETAAQQVLEQLQPIVDRSSHADVILLSPGANESLSDAFVFETAWHGRGSFVIQDPARADRVPESFASLLNARRQVRARARKPFHLVWDREAPIPDRLQDRLIGLLGATGGSLFLLRSPPIR